MDDMAGIPPPMDKESRTAVFPGQSGFSVRCRMLTAGWIGLFIMAGLFFIALPEAWQIWGIPLFCSIGLFLAVLNYRCFKLADHAARRMDCLLGQARDLFWAVDSNLCVTCLCGACVPITGMTPEDLAGRPLTRILTQDAAAAFERLARQGAPFSMEAGIKKPGGGFLVVEISGAPTPEQHQGLCAGVIRDIGETKRQERRISEMKDQLGRSEKLKNLGVLAGSVAHDLNNILSGIATYPEVLLMDSSLDSKTRQGIEMIKDSGRKASSVVSDLLTISRGARADRQVLNLNTVIQRYMAAAEFEKIEQTYLDVEIEVNLEPELLNMKGSYIHVEKAVMNLVLNAVEETTGKPGGRVRLITANHYADNEPDDAQGSCEYVMLSVEDNGSGIPKDFQDNIFDPFFTQKEMGKSGTGLGLTVVQNAVQDHRGKIRVTSDETGTRFDLLFPGIREELPRSEDPNSLEEIRGSGETILIVDDLASQRKIGATILTNLGYKVFTVADGHEALAFVKERPVDLLVLDMIMAPAISGLETYQLIKAVRPDQKAIIASGHSESEDVLKTQELGAGSFVKKPYTIMDMGIAVKEELES